MSETTLKIFFELDVKCNDEVTFANKPILKNESDETYDCITWFYENLENSSIYNLEFDMSKFYINTDILYLSLKIDDNKIINIKLNNY